MPIRTSTSFLLLFWALLVFTVPAQASDDLAFDHSFMSIEGTPLPMSQFDGKVVLVVNTASFCGFTSQYKGLQALYEEYESKGLVVLGIPSNDFGRQEPGTADEIKEFCEVNYDISFPMTEKQKVVGTDAHPFYKWARRKLGPTGKPSWNFHKILVGRKGDVLAGYPSAVAPDTTLLKSAIESALNQP